MVMRADERPPPRWSRMPYLLIIGVVGMRGTEEAAHVLVVLRVLVVVAHDEPDGAACGFAFEDAAEQFHLVGFVARRGDVALSGAPTVELGLNEVQVDVDAGRHAVDDAANGRAMALAEGGQPEYVAKSVLHNLLMHNE